MSEHFPTPNPERAPEKGLTKRAQELYDGECDFRAFISEFTKDELVELWSVCGDGITYSFDDEVYDALAQPNYFEGDPDGTTTK